MRADRLLSVLLLLQVNRRITARELAERLEVSERTILRDMEALGSAGVPVTADRGTGGGWSLVQDYRTNLTGMNAEEVQTLFFARSSRLLADLGLGKAADAALIKLMASLPLVSRQGIDHMRERLHIDGAGWYRSAEAFPFLTTLQEAVWQERRLQMVYQRADGTIAEREVDPLGLVAKGSVWYLIAVAEGDLRSYRVSRVKSASVMEMPCNRPEGFDLASFWEQSVTEFKSGVPRFKATLRVAPELLRRIRGGKAPVIESEEAPDAAGWVSLTTVFQFDYEVCEFAMRYGDQVEVLEPADLRASIIRRAEQILGIYGEKSRPLTIDDV